MSSEMTPVTASAVMPRQRRAERRHRHPPWRYHPRNSPQRTRPSLDAATCLRRCGRPGRPFPGPPRHRNGRGRQDHVRPALRTRARTRPPGRSALREPARVRRHRTADRAAGCPARHARGAWSPIAGPSRVHGRPLGAVAQHPRRASGSRAARQRPRLPAGRAPAPGSRREPGAPAWSSSPAAPRCRASPRSTKHSWSGSNPSTTTRWSSSSASGSARAGSAATATRSFAWAARVAGCRWRSRSSRHARPRTRSSPWSCSSGSSPRSRRR